VRYKKITLSTLRTVSLFFFLSASLTVPAQQKSAFPFVENKGQWNSEVLFGVDLPEGKLYIKKNGLSYRLTNIKAEEKRHHHGHSHGLRESSFSKVDLEFKDSNHFWVVPSKKHQEQYNFYLGSDPSKWAENCSVYDELLFKDVYREIDLRMYSGEGAIKYDWLVGEHADASKIIIKYSDATNIFLEDECAFIVLKSASMMENKPVSYQTDENGDKIMIETSYALKDNELSYVLSKNYDPNKALVIDPELVFSTFSGSISNNFGYTACFDDNGNLYSGGIVFGSSFPVTTGQPFGGGITDIVIQKYDSIGQKLLYATFIGGSGGESPHSLVVNNANELLILGTSGSTDYPTSNSAFDRTYNGGDPFNLFEYYARGTDIVVTKLDPNGRLAASTYIGGSGNDGVLAINSIPDPVNELIYNYGDYQRGDIIIDEKDNVYVASSTEPPVFPTTSNLDFPTTSGIQPLYGGGNSDAVVFSFDSNLSNLLWSTYLGGEKDDAAYSVKLNKLGQVAVGGGTTSSRFPVTSNAFIGAQIGGIDGFITLIDTENDILITSTYVGTPSYDQIYFIDIDSKQNVYAMGQTTGNYPISNGVYSNPNSGQFIHKFNAGINSTIFSTTIGTGNPIPNISPTAFLASECGNLFLSGWGGSIRFSNLNMRGLPITSDAYQRRTDGGDFYLFVLSGDGSELLYATYFGSTNGTPDHVDGGTSRFDKKGIVYQSVCSCGGPTDDFPTTQNAWSETNRARRCNNVAFKFDLATLRAGFQTTDENRENEGINSGCLPSSIRFINTSAGGKEFFWDFGNGVTSTTSDAILVTFDKAGAYNVRLTVRDDDTCISEDTFETTINIYDDQVSISPDVIICDGVSTKLLAAGGVNYNWRPEIGLSNTSISNPIANPPTSTVYEVDITTPNGCQFTESVTVEVNTTTIEQIEVEEVFMNCFSSSTFRFFNKTEYNRAMAWDFGDGQTSFELNPVHTYQNPGVYSIGLEIDEQCLIEQTLTVETSEIFIPNVITPNNDKLNDRFEIKTPVPVDVVIVNRAGKTIYEKDDYDNNWDGGDSPSGVYYYHIQFPNSFICKGWLQIIR